MDVKNLLCKRALTSFLKHCHIPRCLFLFEKGAALNQVYEFEAKSLDKKFTWNLFPTTKLVQNQDSTTRKSAVYP